MKPNVPLIAIALMAATPAFAQNSSAVVTGAVDAQKNRTSATEAKEDTKAGNKQAVSPRERRQRSGATTIRQAKSAQAAR